MTADLSYQNDPRWKDFSAEEKSALNKERFSSDWAQSLSPEAIDKVDKALGAAYKYKKLQVEDTSAAQQKLNAQKQEYSQQDEERDSRQANQAYRY